MSIFPGADYLRIDLTPLMGRFEIPIARYIFPSGCSLICPISCCIDIRSQKTYRRKFVAWLFSEKYEVLKSTPLKLNMESENQPLEMEIPFGTIILRFHVKLWGCTRGKNGRLPIPL